MGGRLSLDGRPPKFAHRLWARYPRDTRWSGPRAHRRGRERGPFCRTSLTSPSRRDRRSGRERASKSLKPLAALQQLNYKCRPIHGKVGLMGALGFTSRGPFCRTSLTSPLRRDRRSRPRARVEEPPPLSSPFTVELQMSCHPRKGRPCGGFGLHLSGSEAIPKTLPNAHF